MCSKAVCNRRLGLKRGSAALTTGEDLLAHEITIFRDWVQIDVQTRTPGIEVAFVTIANNPGRVHAVLERAVRWIETNHPEVQVVDWEIEIL